MANNTYMHNMVFRKGVNWKGPFTEESYLKKKKFEKSLQ